MNYKQFKSRIKKSYSNGLPGKKGQLRMKPYLKVNPEFFFDAPKGAKKSAVLILFYPEKQT